MSMTLEETINSYGNTRYPSLYFDSDNSQAGDLLVMVIVSFASLTSAGSSNIVYSKNQGSVYLNVISTIYTGEYSPSISLTMSASSNCYRIGYRFRSVMALKFEQVDYSQYYTGTFSVNVSKPSANTPMIWFIGSDYGFNDSTNYSASPNDMPYANIVDGKLQITPDIEEEIAEVERGENVSMSEFNMMFAKWLD